MNDEESGHFFKYRSLDGDAKKRTRQTIMDSAIWFSKPGDFNDLFDCSPSYSIEGPTSAFKEYMKRVARKERPLLNRQELRSHLAEVSKNQLLYCKSPAFLTKIRENVQKIMNEFGVLSLSTKPNQVLMWSHYAASHTGICLRFSRVQEDFVFSTARRVIYCAERPIVNPILDAPDTIVAKFILSKANFWAYEDEWRVVTSPLSSLQIGSGPGLIAYNPSLLDGIILGARISKSNAADVVSWVRGRKHPVKLFRSVPNFHSFQLDIEPILTDL